MNASRGNETHQMEGLPPHQLRQTKETAHIIVKAFPMSESNLGNDLRLPLVGEWFQEVGIWKEAKEKGRPSGR